MNPKSEAEAVSQYKPFVLSTARRFSAGGVSMDDLVQEGLIAVATAFRVWRPDGGANFLTWIRRPVYYAMLKLVREQRRAGGSFRGAGRGEKQGEKIALRLVSLDDHSTDRRGKGEDAHLSGDVRRWSHHDENVSLHEKVGSFEEPADPFMRARLPDLVSSLDKRERQVLRLRFEKGLTYAEVGTRLKMSRELARQLEQKALERLKQLMATGEEVES